MKKRLLAGLLSFTMLTGQILPVVAADDADVTVSENAVVEEEAEADVEEEAETVAEVAVEDFDIDSSIEPYAVEENVISEEDGETVSEVSAIYLAKVGENGELELVTGDDVAVAEEALDQATASHIYAGAPVAYTINADSFDVNGTSYSLNATFKYNSRISYRAKKVKADLLDISVAGSSLYSIAQALSTSGQISQDVIKWTYTIKKNTNANAGAYFTAKASVKTKIAKQYGIKGKSLKTLKKAVKLFNKAAKKDHILFNIDQVDFDLAMYNDYVVIVENGIETRRWGMVISRKFTGLTLRVRIRPEQQEKLYTNADLSKWTKPKKKEFAINKIEGKTYSIASNNINYYSRGSYKYTLRFY